MVFLESLVIPITVLAGAITAVIFGLAKPSPSCLPFLKRILPNRDSVFYSRIDFILVVILGSTTAWFLYSPQNAQQGFMSGLGFAPLMQQAMKKFENRGSFAGDEPKAKAKGRK
jgi:energy-converting hydrogenase Eha subunit A